MKERVHCLLVFLIPACSLNLCMAAPSGSDSSSNTTIRKPPLATKNNQKDSPVKRSVRTGKTANIVMRVGWIYSMANAPVIIADKKGYFLEQGIKVELKSYTSGPPIKKDMKEGRLDIAYMGVPAVYKWYPEGVKTRIIAKVNYGQAAVVVHKDSPIKSLQGLRGKLFAGVRVFSGMDVLLRGYVLGDKGKMDSNTDIKIVTMTPEKMGEAVEQKKVAGAFSWEPFTSKYLLRGKTKIIFDMNKVYPGYPWYIIMASPDAVKNKRAALVKILKAHIKAVRFLNSSPVAGDDLIIKAFKLKAVVKDDGTSFPPATILKLAKERLGWQARWARRDTEFMQIIMDHFYKLGYIDKKVNVNDIIDISFLFEAFVSLSTK